MESQQLLFVMFPICLKNQTAKKNMWSQSRLLLLVGKNIEEMWEIRTVKCLALCVAGWLACLLTL